MVVFGSSLSKAVLKLYPAVDKTSTTLCVRLPFHVIMSSPVAVQLLMAVVSDMTEDNIDNTTSNLPPDNSVNQLYQVNEGSQMITILLGRQHLEFTATNVKVTKESFIILAVVPAYEPCKKHTMRK